MSGKWIFLCAVLVGQVYAFASKALVAQRETVTMPDSLKPPISPEDSAHVSPAQSPPPPPAMTAVIQRLRPGFDAGYRTAPLHPYFRNEGQMLYDLRRLVNFVDRKAIVGFESVPELVAIARKLPEAKQTAIIRTAVAGSVANFIAAMLMKQLRQRKLSAVQIEADRVVLQASLQGAQVHLSRGLETNALGLRLPAMRAGYTYAVYREWSSHSVDLSPLSRLALNYTRWAELDIVHGRYHALGGFALISHDVTRKITLYGWHLQHHKNWWGIYFVQHARIPEANWLRVDFWLQW
ncbi:MAG: hypothetical protein ONA90_06795 [candidate division KSB1 bacterium]|nr:hypothetical protein [candidate division KSB1 bacterium]